MPGCSKPAILIALLASCSRSPSPEAKLAALLDQTVRLRLEAKYDAALRCADQGIDEAKDSASVWYWKFYMQKAEIVRRKQGARAALAFLAPEPPPGPAFADARSFRKFYQGWAEYDLANNEVAAQRWDEALEIARAANLQTRIAGIEFSQAQVLNRLNRTAEAEARLRDGNRRALAIGDRDLTAYGLSVLGLMLMDQARFEEALRAFEEEFSMLRVRKGSVALIAFINMGWCRYRLGEHDRALDLFRQAEQLARASGDRNKLQIALGDAGNIYSDRRDYSTARKIYLEALAASTDLEDKQFSARWLANLAKVCIETKDWKNATAYNERALKLKRELKDETGELHSLNYSARILEGERHPAEAEKLFQKVAQTKSQDPEPTLAAHAGLAELYSSAGQDAKAAVEFQAALGVVEKTRLSLHKEDFKMQFLSSLIELHQNYVDFLMSRGKTESALEVAEASRARMLQERAGQAGSTRAMSAAGYKRLAAETGATFFSYWLGPKRSYVWVVNGAPDVTAYPLPGAANLQRLVENYRALIENLRDPLQSEDGSGRELYEAVLAPVIDRVPPGSHVVIVPDGALNALNFETLPVPHPRPHYFLEDATVSVIPSLNLLVRRGPKVRNGRLLLIGDPDFSDDRYPKLPYAAKEIDSIRSHFDSPKVSCYRQQQAEPAVYTKSAGAGFEYIHFTAHASANRENPLDSAIMLSGRNGANKLTARDVLKQPLDAVLVTISACRGAGARSYAGEGLVGFMWAFFQAGARDIIAGLWDVSDESTPRLMDALYTRLTRGEPPAGALHGAKVDLIKENATYGLPYYWAPFQLYAEDIANSPRAAR